MRIVKGLLLFYRKLMPPTLIMAAFCGLLGFPVYGRYSFYTAGIAFILWAMAFHYIIYEVRQIHEYDFYHNLGLSKPVLWVVSFLVSFVFGIFIITI